MSTLQRLQKILHEDFDVALDALQPDVRLESLNIDSLMLIEILFCVEDEFTVIIPSERPDAKEQLQTVADLVAYIDGLVAAQHPASSTGETLR